MTNRNMRSAVAMLASALLAGPVHAQQKWPHMPTAAEVAVMPEYCRAKMGTDTALSDQWNKKMGPDKYMHLHHYCHGLKLLNRLSKTFDMQERRYLLQQATGEFDYVLRNWPDGFDLKAEAQKKKALVQAMLGHS